VTTEPVGKMDTFPKMYNEDPLSIVIAPAINNSTAADAPDLFSTTIAKPLAEAGFYVVPVPYVNHVLALEGINDGTQLKSVPLDKFDHIFGADAVLFVTINKWDTSYVLVSATVTVGLTFELVSTKTNELLWQHESVIVKDTTDNNSNNGLLLKIISTAITTATTDYVPIAKQINWQALSTIPLGRYHSRHGVDGNDASGRYKEVEH
jgi:hypothetical protein